MNVDNIETIRTPREVAIRTIILIGIFQSATGREKQEIIDILTTNKYYEYVSEREKKFLSLPPETTRYIATQLSWRIEGVYILLWALRKVQFNQLPKTPKNLDQIKSLFKDANYYKHISVKSARLRDLEEILEIYKKVYHLHKEIRDAKAKNKEIPHEYHPSLIYEWHYSLKWLLSPEVKWDYITTETE